MTVRNARTGKEVRLSRAMKLFADDRESIDVAYAGDVVGLANPGAFAIGDTLYDGAPLRFHRSRPSNRNISPRCAVSTPRATSRSGRASRSCAKRERFRCSIRTARRESNRFSRVVGELQFEVAKYRLESEYNVKTRVNGLLSYSLARHVRASATPSRPRSCRRTRSSSRIGTAGRSRSSRASGACGSRRSGIRS